MATAGRILIIPKGRYNEETQYDMLDMVSYGGKGWICKKTCIGIAPEEGEYWAESLDVSEEFNEIDSKIDEVEAMVIEEIATRESDIAEVNNKVDVATNIAKGRNQAHVFNTTAEMQAWLSDSANKGLWNEGDNIYIVELDVPDWWVAEVLEEADAENGYYYKIAQLETQKVDLTNYLSQDDVLDTMEEIEANTQENMIGGALAVKEILENIRLYSTYNTQSVTLSETTTTICSLTLPKGLYILIAKYGYSASVNSAHIRAGGQDIAMEYGGGEKAGTLIKVHAVTEEQTIDFRLSGTGTVQSDRRIVYIEALKIK